MAHNIPLTSEDMILRSRDGWQHHAEIKSAGLTADESKQVTSLKGNLKRAGKLIEFKQADFEGGITVSQTLVSTVGIAMAIQHDAGIAIAGVPYSFMYNPKSKWLYAVKRVRDEAYDTQWKSMVASLSGLMTHTTKGTEQQYCQSEDGELRLMITPLSDKAAKVLETALQPKKEEPEPVPETPAPDDTQSTDPDSAWIASQMSCWDCGVGITDHTYQLIFDGETRSVCSDCHSAALAAQ